MRAIGTGEVQLEVQLHIHVPCWRLRSLVKWCPLCQVPVALEKLQAGCAGVPADHKTRARISRVLECSRDVPTRRPGVPGQGGDWIWCCLLTSLVAVGPIAPGIGGNEREGEGDNVDVF